MINNNTIMEIIETKINGFDNVIKHKKTPLPRSRNPHLPPLYFTMLSVASKNSGKTYSIVNLISLFEKSGNSVYDHKGNKLPIRTIWCSPTSNSSANSVLDELKSLDPEDRHEDVDEELLKDIYEQIKTEKAEIEERSRYIEAYKRYVKVNPMKLTDEEIMILSMYDFEHPRDLPKLKYDHPPVIFLVLDDMISSNAVFGSKRSNFISNLCIRHRHYGINLIFTTQSLKAIPNVIRKNLDILQLFKNSNKTYVLDQLQEEVSGILSKDKFEAFYDYVIDKPFGNLCLNMHPDVKKEYRIRNGWDTYLTIK